MELKNRINLYISGLNIVEKIILFNITVYLLPFVLKTVLFLFNIKDLDYVSWFTISADLSELIFKPWSLLTYGFIHGSFSHLFWNMLILYYFGNILINLFGDKLVKKLFLTGIIAGGLTYVFSYNVFPAFKGVNSIMIGASAGVMSVVFFLCSYNPNYILLRAGRVLSLLIIILVLGRLSNFIPIYEATGLIVLYYIIYILDIAGFKTFEQKNLGISITILFICAFLVIQDIIQIPIDNSGGHIAHIGGALWGYYYSVKNNNGSGDLVNSIFSYFKRNKRSKPTFKSKKDNKGFDQKKIDEILDKISDSGYDSLTKSEKEYLFKVGKDDH